jgi:hypothetical protein
VKKTTPEKIAGGSCHRQPEFGIIYSALSLGNFASYWLVALALVGARFTRRRNILSTCPLQRMTHNNLSNLLKIAYM